MPRRARRPLAAVGALALVPALGLGALAWYADTKASAPSIDSAPASTAPLPGPLATPLLSVRRVPASLTAEKRADVVAAAAAPLMAGIDGTSCAAIAVDDRVLLSVNPDLGVIPASNMKIIVAAAALDVLGADATFTTQLVGPAPVGGVVTGDVYLVGGGDPVISEAWYTEITPNHKRPPMHVTSAEALADALVAAGVTSITGRIVGDASRYDTEIYPPGWGAEIRAVADGAPVGPLVIDDSMSANGVMSADPTAAAAAAFTDLLTQRGVTVAGGSGTGAAPTGQGVLASATSAPLVDLVNEMLATSDNLTAEMLVKEIGLKASGRGTRVDGLAAIMARLTAWGVPVTGVQFTDGSGLSRDNILTCRTLLTVLQRTAATDPLGAGLARGGQAGSTLADNFGRTGLGGVLQGKTGSLNGVKSLSGYLVAGNDEVQFVVILNGPTAASYLSSWEHLATTLLAGAGSPALDGLAPAATVG